MKSSKTKFERITSWTFVHPISHCATGGQTLNSVSVNGNEKNTAKSKRMTYGNHELDAVRKFSYVAWLFLAKPLNILHLCMGRRYSCGMVRADCKIEQSIVLSLLEASLWD
jgi:hypothetical protein